MGGDEDGDPPDLFQALQQLPELTPGDGVHSRGGFVEKEDHRLVKDGSGQREPLIDPQGKVGGEGLHVGSESQLFRQPLDPPQGPGHGEAVHLGEVEQILPDGHVLVEGEVLTDVTDAGFEMAPVLGTPDRPAQQGQLPFVDGVEAQEHLDEGGFAGSVGTE